MYEVVGQITLDQWMQWKEDIRKKLNETANNFVYIGYRLKQIRDSGMYGGAADIFEFAEKEYGLGKSTVSRFIAINEKFSVEGNSTELKPEYALIGSSKLSEMLTLSDEECSLITERTTVQEIRELKKFNRQEPEEFMDPPEEKIVENGEQLAAGPVPQYTPLQKCIIDYFKDKPDVLNNAIKEIGVDDDRMAAEIINPSGYATHKKGIIFLFMYEYIKGVKYTTFGQSAVTEMSWADFAAEIWGIYAQKEDVEDVHRAFYGEVVRNEEPKEEKSPKILNEKAVATSQQNEQHKEEKVSKKEKTETVSEQNETGKQETDTVSSDPERKTETESTENTQCDENAEEERLTGEPEENRQEVVIGLENEERKRIWEDEVELNLYRIKGIVSQFTAQDVAMSFGDAAERVKMAYTHAIDLAAGLEKIMRDNEMRKEKEQ